MKVYVLVLGLPWRETRKPTGAKIDWQRYECQMDCNRWRFQKQITQVLCRNMVRGPRYIRPATTFDHLWASEEVVEAFAIWLGECQGLLEASLDGITVGEWNQRMLDTWTEAAAAVAEEEWYSDSAWMTVTSSPRHRGKNCTMGVVYCDELSYPANPWPLPISTPPKHATMQNADKAN